MFSESKNTAIYPEQRSKLEDIIARVKSSEEDGTYATVNGVDTIDDIWYLLDIISHLDDTVIHARGLMTDVAKSFSKW